MTLIAPGMINGKLTLWATDSTTGNACSGNLYSYTFSIDSNNVPTLSQPGPGAAGFPSFPRAQFGTPIPLSTSLTGAYFPVIASNGDDATGSVPSLYSIGTSGNVWEFSGIAGTANAPAPPTTPPSPPTAPDSPLSPTKVQIGTVTAGGIQQLS